MRFWLRLSSVLAAVCIVASVDARAAEKTLSGGLQVSYAEDTDLGIGVRGIYNLENVMSGMEAIGSFDYFFPSTEEGFDVDVSYWELNLNVVYNINLENSSIKPYTGAGLNYAHASVEGSSESDVGLNILGGAVFGTGSIKPFIEAKIEAGGGEQFIVSGGVRF
ncbi:MAG: outer membrane beta-barrel protein [Vicinamibacteria bacterium]|nr:outer membrane beta-barrel protein [Vicinamibacteria bacterium]